MRAGLVVASGSATHVGLRRALNEDSFLAEAPVYLVADGMGGHARGDAASRAVLETFRRHIEFGRPSTPEQVLDAIHTANEAVRAKEGKETELPSVAGRPVRRYAQRNVVELGGAALFTKATGFTQIGAAPTNDCWTTSHTAVTSAPVTAPHDSPPAMPSPDHDSSFATTNLPLRYRSAADAPRPASASVCAEDFRWVCRSPSSSIDTSV